MEAIPQPEKQIYLQSDDGGVWKLTVNNDGMIVTEKKGKVESLPGA